MPLLPAGLPTTPFLHADDCHLVKADPSWEGPLWHQDADDRQLWRRECVCTYELFRLRVADNRPPQPSLERHRYGGDGNCYSYMVQFEWQGSGSRGAWNSHRPRCLTWTHYLPAGYDTKGLANIFLSRKPSEQPAVIHYVALERAHEEERSRPRRGRPGRASDYCPGDGEATEEGVMTTKKTVKPLERPPVETRNGDACWKCGRRCQSASWPY
jgi:hypothetical protein